MNALDSRKKLLIAESELNRAQLVQEWQTMTGEFHALADQAQTVRSMASAAGSLFAGLASLRRKKSKPVAEKTPSWWRTVFKSAGMVFTFWQSVRPQSRAQGDQ